MDKVNRQDEAQYWIKDYMKDILNNPYCKLYPEDYVIAWELFDIWILHGFIRWIAQNFVVELVVASLDEWPVGSLRELFVISVSRFFISCIDKDNKNKCAF